MTTSAAARRSALDAWAATRASASGLVSPLRDMSRRSWISGSTSTTTTTTYLGRQTITTPAGTFETCQVRFVDQGGGTSYTWTVANGPYSGIDVRHSLAIAADGSSAWVREATAIEASFR